MLSQKLKRVREGEVIGGKGESEEEGNIIMFLKFYLIFKILIKN